MAKTANLYARIESKLKKEAENILSELGITASNAITIFYKQIILQNGLPFDVKLQKQHLNISNMNCEELDEELEKGFKDIKEDKVVPMDKAFKEIHKDLGI